MRLNGVISNVEHSYIEVYGPNFSKLKTTQHNYKMGEEDLFWIEFSPTRDILTHHQIII